MPYWQPVGEFPVCIVCGRGLIIRYVQVVFDRMDGKLNESVVYTDNAIRPVFMIVFG